MSDTPVNPTTNAGLSVPAPVLVPPSEAVAIIQMIERAARDPSIDIARMQALIQMREDMRRREMEVAFDEAMTAAQGEMRAVAADSTNAQTRGSKYASLHALDQALRPIYTNHGFSLSFNTAPAAKDTDIVVQCRVAKGGASRDFQVVMPADGRGAKGGEIMSRTHATGSAMTYGRRYLLAMIFNVVTGAEEDDDGNRAGRVERKPPPPGPDVITTSAAAAMAAAEARAAIPTIQDRARAAASKGDAAFKAFYKDLTAPERYQISIIGGELRALINEGPTPHGRPLS